MSDSVLVVLGVHKPGLFSCGPPSPDDGGQRARCGAIVVPLASCGLHGLPEMRAEYGLVGAIFLEVRDVSHEHVVA
jgi:hypothetical protein